MVKAEVVAVVVGICSVIIAISGGAIIAHGKALEECTVILFAENGDTIHVWEDCTNIRESSKTVRFKDKTGVETRVSGTICLRSQNDYYCEK